MKEYIIAFECPVTESSERTAYQVQQKLVGELIRCKDCKYLWHEVAEDLTPYGFYNERHIFLCQKHFDKEMGELREVMIDDFCSWAERKEE